MPLRHSAVVLIAATGVASCVNYPPNPPTVPSPVTVTVTNTATSDQQQGITVPIVTTPTPQPTCPAGQTCTPTPGTGTPGTPDQPGRAPDPVNGTVLPLPFQGASVPAAVALFDSQALKRSCVQTYGQDAWSFLDQVVDALRQFDTRWGYVCSSTGDCANPIQDAVAYHATAGPEAIGVQGVWVVDVIESYCLVNPQPGWTSLGYQPAGRWTSRNRF